MPKERVVCMIACVRVCVCVCCVCVCEKECVCASVSVSEREWCSQFWNSDQALIEEEVFSLNMKKWFSFVQSELEQASKEDVFFTFVSRMREREGRRKKAKKQMCVLTSDQTLLNQTLRTVLTNNDSL